MLFRQSDLALDPIQEANAILNEAEYLAESESATSAVAIPVVENARIGACVVKFDDLSRLAEDHGMTFDDAMVTVAEANGVDPEHLAVAVRETTVMAHPGIVNELYNVVVTPLPETDTMYQFTEACVNAFVESGDEYYMDFLVEATYNSRDEAMAASAAKYEAEKKSAPATSKPATTATSKPATTATTAAKKPAFSVGYHAGHDGTGFEIDDKGNRTNYVTAGGRMNMLHQDARLDRAIAKAEMKNASGVKKLLKAVKYYGWNTPKERILAAINALQKKYQEMVRNIPADEKKQSFWQSILKTIDKYISKLTHLFKKKVGDTNPTSANARVDAILNKDDIDDNDLTSLQKIKDNRKNMAGSSGNLYRARY